MAGSSDPGIVFSPIRKTVVTVLGNLGVLENLAADIVGHEKPRITYGLYSGGATLEVTRGVGEARVSCLAGGTRLGWRLPRRCRIVFHRRTQTGMR